MARTIVVLGFFTVLCAAAWAAETYTNAFLNMDTSKILASKRLVENYVLCLTDKDKPCPPEGAELKRLLPEIIKTNCAKCSDGHIKKAAEVLQKLRNDYPDSYKKLSAVWDSTGEAFNKFDQLAKSKQ